MRRRRLVKRGEIEEFCGGYGSLCLFRVFILCKVSATLKIMSTTTTNTTAIDDTATGSDNETKIIIRAMFGVAAALTLITGLFFAHVWIYRVRRL